MLNSTSKLNMIGEKLNPIEQVDWLHSGRCFNNGRSNRNVVTVPSPSGFVHTMWKHRQSLRLQTLRA